MSIYLINDKFKRQEDYLIKESIDLNSYNDILIFTDNPEAYSAKIEDLKTERYLDWNCSCLLIHKGVLDENPDLELKIKEFYVTKNIPVVIFSGGESGSSFFNEGLLLKIDVKLFYSKNLLEFLNEYRKEEIINLAFLAYGEYWGIEQLAKINRELISIGQNFKVAEELDETISIDMVLDKAPEIDSMTLNMPSEFTSILHKDFLSKGDIGRLYKIINTKINEIMFFQK